ncbi:MAG: hypothetical protein PHY48_10075, partial [Candidatus Cloacimonetes bacterium]|nr:hypothetical protein [Candidatus Cloacimonadota bacterium]
MSKFRVFATESHLSFVQYEITGGEIDDDKLNPGESATIKLDIKNTGMLDLTGNTTLEAHGGVQASLQNPPTEIPAGGTAQFMANVQLPSSYSETNVSLDFKYMAFNQAGNPVIYSIPIQIPVDFYVKIDEITSP